MEEPKLITYEEVTERLKNKKLEEYTYDDVFDRYVGYGEKHELAQVEVQRLFIKHRMIEELLFVAPRNIITDKEVIEGILSSNAIQDNKFKIIKRQNRTNKNNKAKKPTNRNKKTEPYRCRRRIQQV